MRSCNLRSPARSPRSMTESTLRDTGACRKGTLHESMSHMIDDILARIPPEELEDARESLGHTSMNRPVAGVMPLKSPSEKAVRQPPVGGVAVAAPFGRMARKARVLPA